MSHLIGWIFFILTLYIPFTKGKYKIPEDALLDIPEIIIKYGYPMEKHYVTTEDNYILEMHRIPHDQQTKSMNSKNRPTIFLQHGIAATSDVWILLGPGKALGFLLADAGFDVWIGNTRGNMYSKNHTYLNSTSSADRRKYWDVSFYDSGMYDLPANIDYILAAKNESQLFYVGHSQGCSSVFAMCSELPHYNDKIKAIFALAPGVYLKNSPLLNILGKWFEVPLMTLFAKSIGHFDFVPHEKDIAYLATQVCAKENPLQEICRLPYLLIAGYTPDQLNTSFVPIIFSHFPAGASTKQLFHFIQLKISGNFQKYDYGAAENKKLYRQITPPKFKLARIRVPTYLYCGSNDWLIDLSACRKFAKELPSLVHKVEVSHPKWAHNDFVYGTNAKESVYDLILNTLNSIIEE